MPYQRQCVSYIRLLARLALPGPDELARAGPEPVRDDHVRVLQLMPVGAVRRRYLGDAAVGIRPKLHHELLEHVFAYLGIPISPRHAGQGVSAVGGRSYLSIAVAPLALST
jgi:hypothetical protein